MDLKNIFYELNKGKNISINNVGMNNTEKNFIMYTNARGEAVIIPTLGITSIERNGKRITLNYSTRTTLNYDLYSEMDVEVVISRINEMRVVNGEYPL